MHHLANECQSPHLTSTFIYGAREPITAEECALAGVIERRGVGTSRSRGAGNASTRHFAHRPDLFSFPGNSSLLCQLSPRSGGEGTWINANPFHAEDSPKSFIKTWQRVKVSLRPLFFFDDMDTPISDESLFFYYVCKCLMIRCDESEYQSVFAIRIDSRAKWKQDTCWNDFSRAFRGPEKGCPSGDGLLGFECDWLSIEMFAIVRALKDWNRGSFKGLQAIGKFEDMFEVCDIWRQTRRLLSTQWHNDVIIIDIWMKARNSTRVLWRAQQLVRNLHSGVLFNANLNFSCQQNQIPLTPSTKFFEILLCSPHFFCVLQRAARSDWSESICLRDAKC